MKRLKLRGFTLIELIVVMAIIAVLVTVLVPNAVAYIVDAKFNTANQNAKLAYNAAAQYCVEYSISPVAYEGSGDAPVEVDRKSPHQTYLDAITQEGIDVVRYTSRYEMGVEDFVTTLSMEEAISKALGSALIGSVYIPIVDDSSTGVFTIRDMYWAEDRDTRYVGCYPNRIDGDVERESLRTRVPAL